ncbi:MAG: redox-regulated ATPase YchF [Anaerolineaceae bacterium]|nr:redox-regulated ATPase YchF [Anaerolineaceae bacterium]
MRLGIIGLPNSGKTTLFNALTSGDYETSAVSSGQFHVNTSVVNVPDERLEVLEEMYDAKKKVYATITYTDIGGLDKGIGEGGLSGQLRNELSQVDGFVHVIRVFESNTVPHPFETIDPQRDLETLDSEFLLLDLVAVENRLEKIESELKLKGKRADQNLLDEQPIMERFKAHLDEGRPLRDLDVPEKERKMIGGFGFLTLKPVLIVLNLGDERKSGDDQLNYDYKHANHIALQASLEADLAQLDADDATMFMEEYGVTELSASRVVRLSYELVNIHSFLTAGEKEVRAWTIPVGATAYEAAGAIHGDIQKGFIRAEVTPYTDLAELGSEAAVKAAGKMRLESKEYVVQDGDVIVFRHSS